MTFNIPISVYADVHQDDITKDQHSTELTSVQDLSSVQLTLNEDDGMQEKRCAACGEDLSDDEPTQTVDGETSCWAREDDDAPHTPEWAPLTWAKNITVSLDEDDDRIELSIATGDPRDGWTLTLRRDHETGVVHMSVPYEGMNSQHEPMQEIHPGTFAIG